MKKIFSYLGAAFMVLFLLILSPSSAFSQDIPPDNGDSDTVPDYEVTVRDVINPTPERPGRSLLPTVEGILYSRQNVLELVFHTYVGQVTVTVLKSPEQPVALYTCDTATEPVILLPVPSEKGRYTIYIAGPDYEGIGYYTR